MVKFGLLFSGPGNPAQRMRRRGGGESERCYPWNTEVCKRRRKKISQNFQKPDLSWLIGCSVNHFFVHFIFLKSFIGPVVEFPFFEVLAAKVFFWWYDFWGVCCWGHCCWGHCCWGHCCWGREYCIQMGRIGLPLVPWKASSFIKTEKNSSVKKNDLDFPRDQR